MKRILGILVALMLFVVAVPASATPEHAMQPVVQLAVNTGGQPFDQVSGVDFTKPKSAIDLDGSTEMTLASMLSNPAMPEIVEMTLALSNTPAMSETPDGSGATEMTLATKTDLPTTETDGATGFDPDGLARGADNSSSNSSSMSTVPITTGTGY